MDSHLAKNPKSKYSPHHHLTDLIQMQFKYLILSDEFRAMKPFSWGILDLGTSETPTGQAGCLQGQNRSAVTHPSSNTVNIA
ncbi:hypothetical protein J6590_034772 [Homalodisca vitripennis]|nr:hypothetical protein J6590_034772 [Homalodisca vitripennis]